MTQISQTNSELHVFGAFVKATNGLIDSASVSKKKPPEPDIQCEYTAGGIVAFEIVEFLEEDFARTKGFYESVRKALYDHLYLMATEEGAEFKCLYANADIQVNFQEDCSKNRALQAVPAIFQELLSKSPDFEGLIDTFNDGVLPKAIVSISVRRGQQAEPSFDLPLMGFLDDPCVNTIQSKIKKNYQTEYPIELIAYIGQNPMFPEEIWKRKLLEFLGKSESIGPFRKIWILDLDKNKIELEWPEP